jgi:hypothetical protein
MQVVSDHQSGTERSVGIQKAARQSSQKRGIDNTSPLCARQIQRPHRQRIAASPVSPPWHVQARLT